MIDYDMLSKEVSYALRHAPQEYGLELDNGGWADLQQLLNALNAKEAWRQIKAEDMIRMIELSEKKRHEIKNEKIRALYGHSTASKIQMTASAPPETLYHGTARRFLPAIRREGLKPMSRQYVHLTEDASVAKNVGLRRDNTPSILTISAQKAYMNGVVFYHSKDSVWLADYIPPEYIFCGTD